MMKSKRMASEMEPPRGPSDCCWPLFPPPTLAAAPLAICIRPTAAGTIGLWMFSSGRGDMIVISRGSGLSEKPKRQQM